MRFRDNMILLGICLPICLMLRVLQLIFTIDNNTGFIKQQFFGISTIITLIILAGIISVGLIGFATDNIKAQKKDKNPLLALSSLLAGGMFFYNTVASLATFKTSAWYDMLAIFLGLITAAIFVAFGLKNIYDYSFPNVLLIVPACYYILRLITIFISTSTLALVTKNIFFIFANSSLLLFLFEFSKIENNIDQKPKYKKLFAIGIITIMLCFTESLPKFITHGNLLSQRDTADGILAISMGVFVLTYILSSFSDSQYKKSSHVAKHLAE